MRIGVINWDSSLPPETYFGGYTSRALSPERYRARVPYYADITKEGNVVFPRKDAESVGRELQYAVDAGIDYFAYCWYPEGREAVSASGLDAEKSCVDGLLWELNHTRKLHEQSSLREKIRLCAILVCMHFYSETDLCALLDAMREPYYETVSGRPLVYLFGGYRTDYIRCLRTLAKDAGMPQPFLVFLNNGPENSADFSEADAVCAYACCTREISSFAEMTDGCIADNERRKKYGIPVLPFFSVGWNPMPRVDASVPWTSYPRCSYAHPASAEEIGTAAARFGDWMLANRSHILPDTVLTFAWNEFEEGGYLCPTRNEAGQPDDTRLRAFADAAREWKRMISSERMNE